MKEVKKNTCPFCTELRDGPSGPVAGRVQTSPSLNIELVTVVLVCASASVQGYGYIYTAIFFSFSLN